MIGLLAFNAPPCLPHGTKGSAMAIVGLQQDDDCNSHIGTNKVKSFILTLY